MSIGSRIIGGSAIALKFAKTMFGNPTLSYRAGESGPKTTVPLEVENHQQNVSADISESLVITKDYKKNISDNVAPGAWSWDISGYIPGSIAGAVVPDMTNYFTPLVKKNTDILRAWAKEGTILEYKDIDKNVYKRVAIKSLSVSIQADAKNKQPFSMQLKEINVMDDLSLIQDVVEQASTPASGSALGNTAEMGLVFTTLGTYTSAAILSSLHGRQQKTQEVIKIPSTNITDNFSFQANVSAGVFTFLLKWSNERWNCWVTLPKGVVRGAGVNPNVLCWTGMSDYGLEFKTELKTKIGRNDLSKVEIILYTWN